MGEGGVMLLKAAWMTAYTCLCKEFGAQRYILSPWGCHAALDS